MNATTTRKSILTAIADAYYSLTCRESAASEFGVWEFVNENELAEEMSNSQADPCPPESTFEEAAEDFEKAYQWFIS